MYRFDQIDASAVLSMWKLKLLSITHYEHIELVDFILKFGPLHDFSKDFENDVLAPVWFHDRCVAQFTYLFANMLYNISTFI